MSLSVPAIVAGCALHRSGAGRPIVCVPGFGDAVGSWLPLIAALAARGCDVAIVEPPGWGDAPPPSEPADIAGYAARIAAVVQQTWQEPVTLVGHSISGPIAIRAAYQLGAACAALFSIEGNVTPADAYHSGRALNFTDAVRFKASHCVTAAAAVAGGSAPVSYALALQLADARALWQLGRDAIAQSATFGPELRALAIPHRFVWSATTTSSETQAYLREHAIPNVQISIEYHWPWLIDAPAIATEITSLARS